jgi:hypothetical protein
VAAKNPRLQVRFGLDGHGFRELLGTNFLFLDHGYYLREWEHKFVRIVRGNVHLTRIVKGPSCRLGKFGVKLRDYRRTGSKIVVIKPGRIAAQILGIVGKAEAMAEECRKYTDREIVFKPKDGKPLPLDDAWAVVCPVSVGAVESLVAGIPVFSTPMCPSWPMNAGALQDIEKPTLHERYEWANSLAWSTWHESELDSIKYEEYQCA